jgi:hypothetical protein
MTDFGHINCLIGWAGSFGERDFANKKKSKQGKCVIIISKIKDRRKKANLLKEWDAKPPAR